MVLLYIQRISPCTGRAFNLTTATDSRLATMISVFPSQKSLAVATNPYLGLPTDPPYPAHSPELPPDFDIGALLNGLEGVEQQRAEAYSPGGGNVSPQYAAFEPPQMARAPEHSPGLPPDFDIGAFLNGLEGVEQQRAEAYSPGGSNVSPQYAAFEPPKWLVLLNNSHSSRLTLISALSLMVQMRLEKFAPTLNRQNVLRLKPLGYQPTMKREKLPPLPL